MIRGMLVNFGSRQIINMAYNNLSPDLAKKLSKLSFFFFKTKHLRQNSNLRMEYTVTA